MPTICIVSKRPILAIGLAFCTSISSLRPHAACGQTESVAPPRRTAVVTRVVTTADGFRLERGGQPYFIRGAGGDGSLKALAAAGGNSVRTWGADKLERVLDEAQQNGITVAVGIWLGHERHGFNYNDADQVAKLAESVRETILKFKDHPAVLLWGLGNEMEGYEKGDNAAIWLAINNLAGMVKRLDPDHPTMTVVAEIGGDRVKNIHRLCPDIDIVGINTYAGAASIPERYKEAGGTRPYLLTEFGPPGTWETTKTAWGVAPELTSTEKATWYRKSYEAAVTSQRGRCLGSYAFVWGSKQEATATWFGLLLPDGSRLGAVDTLTELWTGKAPTNRCPIIRSFKLDGADQVEPKSIVRVSLDAADPERDPIKVRWVLQREPSAYGQGGDAEEVPPTFPDAIVRADNSSVEVRLPADGGGYRLFAFVNDDHGGAAVANVALLVKGPVPVPSAKPATLPLVVYDEATREKPPFAPTGWMGNTKGMKLDESCETQPHAGKTCLRFDFIPKEGWGGIVWQNPPGDWGDRPGGWNVSGAKRLTFWARGERGGEVASFQFGLLGKDKKFSDTATGKLDKVALTTKWQRLEIDITGQDLSRIKTGFACVVAAEGQPVTLYLDDIAFE
ncbi:MAG: hypothetical protein HZA46_24230 [Planctomycetales bacterium]|nr:hypothetical protein [Planctomycetales bacterium]